VQRVDEPNARLVAATRENAHRVIDLTDWDGVRVDSAGARH
jgi:hypothetical protein